MRNSKIQWTHHTWNPWHGCLKVSPGCAGCYMYREKYRWGGGVMGGRDVKRSEKSTFNQPLKFQSGLVFTCSWSDFFIEEADKWREDAWEIIRKTPYLTYQILTKRPERIKYALPDDWGRGYQNVWLGISAENQEHFENRFKILLEVPAHIRFVSAEPLLAPIKIPMVLKPFIDWLIIGGESGYNTGPFTYRECQIEWIENLVNNNVPYKVPVFVKQLGSYLAKQLNLKDRVGGDLEEWPNQVQVRQFPSQTLQELPW